MKTTEFEFSFKGSVKQEKAERKRYSIKSYCKPNQANCEKNLQSSVYDTTVSGFTIPSQRETQVLSIWQIHHLACHLNPQLGPLSGQQTENRASGLEMAPHFSGLFSQARTHSHLTTSKNEKHSLGPKWCTSIHHWSSLTTKTFQT